MSTMIIRYRPRRVMTTYTGKPALLWRAFDEEGHWTGHHATEETAWQAMGFVAWCACGHAYTAQQWAKLELVGDVDGVLEQRDCVCGSTISREKDEPAKGVGVATARNFEATPTGVRSLYNGRGTVLITWRSGKEQK